MVNFVVVRGLLYPFLGTVFGSSFVFLLKNKFNNKFLLFLDSFAAGIMSAASFFSLLAPGVGQAEKTGKLSLFLCSVGFIFAFLFFIFTDKILKKYLSVDSDKKAGNMLLWAVSIHNIPEGMAVGVIYAGILSGQESVSIAGALTLSIGIALQNIPEGAIISMPLNARGKSKAKSFGFGLISGVAELVAGIITLFLSSFIYGMLPFSLCFAAGAMFYVVLSELSEGFSDKTNGDLALFMFGVGFIIMMLLDTFLG